MINSKSSEKFFLAQSEMMIKESLLAMDTFSMKLRKSLLKLLKL